MAIETDDMYFSYTSVLDLGLDPVWKWWIFFQQQYEGIIINFSSNPVI